MNTPPNGGLPPQFQAAPLQAQSVTEVRTVQVKNLRPRTVEGILPGQIGTLKVRVRRTVDPITGQISENIRWPAAVRAGGLTMNLDTPMPDAGQGFEGEQEGIPIESVEEAIRAATTKETVRAMVARDPRPRALEAARIRMLQLDQAAAMRTVAPMPAPQAEQIGVQNIVPPGTQMNPPAIFTGPGGENMRPAPAPQPQTGQGAQPPQSATATGQGGKSNG